MTGSPFGKRWWTGRATQRAETMTLRTACSKECFEGIRAVRDSFDGLNLNLLDWVSFTFVRCRQVLSMEASGRSMTASKPIGLGGHVQHMRASPDTSEYYVHFHNLLEKFPGDFLAKCGFESRVVDAFQPREMCTSFSTDGLPIILADSGASV